MADVKISALPAATTPLAGTELVPIVQSGVTSQVSVNNLTAGKTVAASTVNVDANTASAAVRVTQTGSGNALLVEDSANPDATPFVVSNDGRVVVGHTAPLTTAPGTASSPLQVQNNIASADFASIGVVNWVAAVQGTGVQLSKSRSGVIGTRGIVSDGDAIGRVQFNADDGVGFIAAARIEALVDGTPGTNDMPGRLVFSTTADGASSPSERMRITNAGNVGINSSNPTARLNIVDNTSQDAVRITQTGTGNALVVEDETSPDATPFVVTANGAVGIGTPAPTTNLTVIGNVNVTRTGTTSASQPARLDMQRQRAGGVIVQDGDDLATLATWGWDGAAYIQAASILSEVDGTPGTNDMPGRLVFSTTADGASSPSERMRITNAGLTSLTGSFGRGAPVTKTGNFTLADTENWIICNGAGSITVTFPAAASWTGREVMIKTIAAQTVVSASSNVVPLAGGAAGTAILPASAGAWATLVSDGTNWIIMQS